MFSSIQIGSYFLSLAHQEDKNLTPLQIIKLVYLAHAWMLGLHEKDLINENVRAWDYGPVFPKLYKKIKMYGNSPVKEIGGSEDVCPDEQQLEIIDSVWSSYGDKSGGYLSALTHEKDTPWDQTRTQQGIYKTIPRDMILEYYKNKAKQLNIARSVDDEL